MRVVDPTMAKGRGENCQYRVSYAETLTTDKFRADPTSLEPLCLVTCTVSPAWRLRATATLPGGSHLVDIVDPQVQVQVTSRRRIRSLET